MRSRKLLSSSWRALAAARFYDSCIFVNPELSILCESHGWFHLFGAIPKKARGARCKFQFPSRIGTNDIASRDSTWYSENGRYQKFPKYGYVVVPISLTSMWSIVDRETWWNKTFLRKLSRTDNLYDKYFSRIIVIIDKAGLFSYWKLPRFNN